jgi:hypothetical protein
VGGDLRIACAAAVAGGFYTGLAAGSGEAVGRRSFLKKRTKKPLRVWARCIRRGRSQTNKSFLLLFFKKEDLPS